MTQFPQHLKFIIVVSDSTYKYVLFVCSVDLVSPSYTRNMKLFAIPESRIGIHEFLFCTNLTITFSGASKATSVTKSRYYSWQNQLIL